MNFWSHFASASRDKPILCLAPMADVTDAAFRHIIAKYSKEKNSYPYVTYTEFVSADGLVRAGDVGRKKLLKDLEYSEIERPIVAQFFTSNPDHMYKAAKLAVELGFDGVDINMGCPDKSIEKQGSGAALIKDPKLARELIAAAKRGVQKRYKDDHCTNDKCGVIKNEIPVSVKTRLGYNKDELEEWLPDLLSANPAAIIIHARTRKEMSEVPARWERIKDAVDLRNKIQDLRKEKTLIIGNGDMENVEDAIKKCKETGADGVMLGRAIFGNPWLFTDHLPSTEERLKVLIEHAKLFEEKFLGIKSFAIMKKHFKAYIKDFDGSKELREKLMETENANQVEEILNDFMLKLRL